VIRTFRSKALEELFRTGGSRKIRPDLIRRTVQILDILHAAKSLGDMNFPGLRCHPLKGKPLRHALAVNGPWRVTFVWKDGDAETVDLEQYH
jgi:proteic killer suppression protein